MNDIDQKYIDKLSDSKKKLLKSISINGNEIIVGNKRIVRGEFVEFHHDEYIYIYDLRTRKYKKLRKLSKKNDVQMNKSEGDLI